MRSYEIILLRNIWILCMFLILIILALLCWNWLGDKIIFSNEYLVSCIGLITAFWYWYKRYERDKEIELIKYFSEKYNISKLKIFDHKELANYKELLTVWYEEYFLHDKWYITQELWNEWEYWIKEDIKEFINNAHQKFNNRIIDELTEIKEDDIQQLKALYAIEDSPFFEEIVMTYFPNDKIGIITLRKDKFSKFITKKIEEEFNKYIKQTPHLKNKLWIDFFQCLIKEFNNPSS